MSMVTKYSQSPAAGCSAAASAGCTRRADRRRGKPGAHIGVPRRLLGAVGVGGGDLDPVQRVVHRRVELQRAVLGQPVVDDPRDLREVVRHGFALHQRPDDQDLVRRHVHRLRGVEQPALRVLASRSRRSAWTGCPAPTADGSIFQVPGAISPSNRRWSSPSALTGFDGPVRDRQRRRLRPCPPPVFRSSADTQCAHRRGPRRSPGRSG